MLPYLSKNGNLHTFMQNTRSNYLVFNVIVKPSLEAKVPDISLKKMNLGTLI